MTTYDSVHGRVSNVSHTKDSLVVNGKHIKVLSDKVKSLSELPWKSLGADIILDCTGIYLDTNSAKGHLEGGAKKVIMSAPSKDDTPMFV